MSSLASMSRTNELAIQPWYGLLNEDTPRSVASLNIGQGYCKLGNFHVGVIFVFFALLSSPRKLPHAKIKPICLYEGNRSSIVIINPTWNVLPTFSRNFPPAKITTFTVNEQAIWPWYGLLIEDTPRSVASLHTGQAEMCRQYGLDMGC